MAGAYYNENDPYAAAWLRGLIAAGLIMDGDVDDRSIEQVQAGDVRGYSRCHFFAGIGGWDYALQLAGWERERPVWTGSCPCPPFSCAGKKKRCPSCQGRNLMPHVFRTGVFACCDCGWEWLADGRHLWPEFRRLVEACRPDCVMGEQVASDDGLVWLAGVQACLEVLGYDFRRADLPAAGVGAPQRRQRLWWVAHAAGLRGIQSSQGGPDQEAVERAGDCGEHGGLAESRGVRQPEHAEQHGEPEIGSPDGDPRGQHADGRGEPGGVGHAKSDNERRDSMPGEDGQGKPNRGSGGDGPWGDFDVVWCDERASGKGFVPRRVESGTFPLAHGVPCRVGKLRAYGNAIVPQVAAKFIRAYGA